MGRKFRSSHHVFCGEQQLDGRMTENESRLLLTVARLLRTIIGDEFYGDIENDEMDANRHEYLAALDKSLKPFSHLWLHGSAPNEFDK